VIITGDVSPAQAYAWVDKHFRKWQPGPDPFATAIPPVKPLAAPAVTVVAGAVDQVTVSIQWHGPSARSNVRDTYAADVFSDVLNAGISGFQERLSGAGLFQDISISYHTQNHTGPITIRGITTADNAADAIQALRNEIAKFDDPGYLTQDLLDIAKKRRLVAAEFGLERGSALAHTLAANWSVSGLDYFLGYVDNMQTVKLDELQKYVTTYIAGKPFAAAALTSPAHKPALTALMTSTFGQGVIK
jgi:zinc protease